MLLKLTVTARDEGGRSASSSVQVNVENLNDNNPTIDAPELVYLEADIFPGDVVFSFQVRNFGKNSVYKMGANIRHQIHY